MLCVVGGNPPDAHRRNVARRPLDRNGPMDQAAPDRIQATLR